MKVAVIGAGGHAKVVIATIRAAGHEVVGLYDDNTPGADWNVLGVPVVGRLDDLIRASFPAVIAVGSNEARKRIAASLPTVEWATVIHPNSIVHDTVVPGPGTVVFAGVVIQPATLIGHHVIVNTGATIDHDCEVGSYAHLAPGSHLAGSVTIGEGTLFGIGAVAIPGVAIGAWSVVGAGAAVVSDVPGGVTFGGTPARRLGR